MIQPALRVNFLLLFLFISFAPAHLTQCSSDGSNKLKFVAQLSVSGCAIFVHDTGAPDGPHLAVEPLMCVTESVDNLIPRYDMITDQTYLSVAVMMRDTSVLEEVQRQLRHLSPNSVKFARVRDIRVISDNSSNIQDVEFIWSPEESVGYLRFLCTGSLTHCSNKYFRRLAFHGVFLSRFRLPEIIAFLQDMKIIPSKAPTHHTLHSAINHVKISANIEANNSINKLKYQLMVQNYSFINPDIYTTRYTCLKSCDHLRFVRSIRLSNCIARVHQRLDMKGHFVIEPLLCHNITSMSNDSIMYDHSSDMYYLKLDLVLQNDVIVDNIRSQLSDLSPRNFTFKRLWRAQISVSSVLNGRYEISQLMVSSDGRIGALLVYCRSEHMCKQLRSALNTQPELFWRRIQIKMHFLTPQNCLLKSEDSLMYMINYSNPTDGTNNACLLRFANGKTFLIIQQRLRGSVSFHRNWNEYESGFGDETDFWIGLSSIHALSKNGVTLRVEMKLWNGTQQHAEYAGFQVGDASTNYRMTLTDILRDRSNVTFDALGAYDIRGMQFSTKDRDNDGWSGDSCSNLHDSCSNLHGSQGGGWWFKQCTYFNPNGMFGQACQAGMSWHSGSSWVALREVRLMIQ